MISAKELYAILSYYVGQEENELIAAVLAASIEDADGCVSLEIKTDAEGESTAYVTIHRSQVRHMDAMSAFLFEIGNDDVGDRFKEVEFKIVEYKKVTR